MATSSGNQTTPGAMTSAYIAAKHVSIHVSIVFESVMPHNTDHSIVTHSAAQLHWGIVLALRPSSSDSAVSLPVDVACTPEGSFLKICASERSCSLQVPALITSEHVLLIHRPDTTRSVVSTLVVYTIMGLRLEEARADVAFGVRLLNSATSHRCPFQGRDSCRPHLAVACTVIVASLIDYIAELCEVRASRI